MYFFSLCTTNALKIFSCGTFSGHIEPIDNVDMRYNDDKLKRCFGIFQKQPWPNFLTNIHSVILKILSSITSIQKPVCQLICFTKSIGWMVSICDNIFRESLMGNSCSHVINLHSFYSNILLFILRLLFKEFGWTILSN